MRILLVDDDAALMETLAKSLIRQRYAVDIAENGATAQEFLALFSYDLLVLDMLLPDVDGISLCRQCRHQGKTTPILMLTAEDSKSDKVKALDAGADDYVVKPFDFEELCARMRALLRRDSPQVDPSLHWGQLWVNPTTFEVTYGEATIHTTPKEYALLALFLRHPSRVFSLEAIIENLWTYDDPPSGDAVRTHIKGLRQKLKAGGAPKDLIETVYGMGYRLKALASESAETERVATAEKMGTEAVKIVGPELGVRSPVPQVSPRSMANSLPLSSEADPSETDSPKTDSPKTDFAVAIADAWATHHVTMQKRLQALQSAASSLRQGHLPLSLQQESKTQAHKLAGSLGCFGFPKGSALARRLEQMLTTTTSFDDHQTAYFSQLVDQLQQALPQHPEQQRDAPIPSLPESGEMNVFSPPLHILVMTADLTFPKSLTDPTLQITVATHLTEAQDLVQRHHDTLDGVLIEITPANYDESLGLLDAILATMSQAHSNLELSHSPAAIAVLIATDITDAQQRLTLVQRGGDRLLPASPSLGQIVPALQEILHTTRAAFRIVLLDDDEQLLAQLHSLLVPQGWQLTTTSHAATLWNLLDQVQPHLLVLDVEMPDINGLDLCQMLRADERWRQLPIIFLTAHTEPGVQHHAFDVGGDDFVNKADLATELPRRIRNRLKRSPFSHLVPVALSPPPKR
ncbi:MAG: response regulator [Leptolyngbyaceae cyanobacterium]